MINEKMRKKGSPSLLSAIAGVTILTPRRWEDEEEIDLDPEQLAIIQQTERNLSQAGGESMQKLTANLEMLMHRASEQADLARTVEFGQCYVTKDSVMDGNSSTPFCRVWYSKPRSVLGIHVLVVPVYTGAF